MCEKKFYFPEVLKQFWVGWLKVGVQQTNVFFSLRFFFIDGPSLSSIFQEFLKHDTDQDGKIDFNEFLRYIEEHEQKLKLHFRKIDTNQDGRFIQYFELCHDKTDTNQDGRFIQYFELCHDKTDTNQDGRFIQYFELCHDKTH